MKELGPKHSENTETNEVTKTLRELIQLGKILVNNPNSTDFIINRLDHRKLRTHEGEEKMYPCKIIVTYTKTETKTGSVEKIDINKSFEPLSTMIDGEMRMAYDVDMNFYDITSPLLGINETYDFTMLIITKVYRIKPVSLRQINKLDIYSHSKNYGDIIKRKGLNKFNPDFTESQLNQIFEYFIGIKNGNNLFGLHEIVKGIVDKLGLDNLDHDYTMRIEYLCYEIGICNERTTDKITDHNLILKRLRFTQKAFEEFIKQKNERFLGEIGENLNK